MCELGLHKHNHKDGIAQAQFTSRESKMADYVFLSADSADEKTLMLTLMLMYAWFTLKYSQHKHKRVEKVPFLVLMLMLKIICNLGSHIFFLCLCFC